MLTLTSSHNLLRNLVFMYFNVAKGRVHSQIQVMIGRRQDFRVNFSNLVIASLGFLSYINIQIRVFIDIFRHIILSQVESKWI